MVTKKGPLDKETLLGHFREILETTQLSPIPIRNDKAAMLKGWRGFEGKQPTIEQCEQWLDEHDWIAGIGIVCGKLDSTADLYLEVIDIERRFCIQQHAMQFLSDEMREILGNLYEGLLFRLSQSGGVHVYYLCDVAEGNQVLARDADGKLLIETRASGGQIAYLLGEGYSDRKGDLRSLVKIPRDKRDALLDLFRSCDKTPEEDKPKEPAKQTRSASNQADIGSRPGDDFNRRGLDDFTNAIIAAGWSTGSNGRSFRRPGKSKKQDSIRIEQRDGQWKVTAFESDLVELPTGEQVTLFHAFTQLVHRGDEKAAVKALAAKGYGEQRKTKPKNQRTSKPQPAAETESTPSGWSLSFAPDGKKTKVYARIGEDVRHVDTFNLASSRGRETFLKGCSEAGATDEDLEQLSQDLMRIEAEGIPEPEPAEETVDELEATIQRELERTDPAIIAKAKEYLSGSALEWAANLIADYGIVGERDLVESLYLCFTSRLLRKPVSAIISSSSSSGKSFISDKIAELMPPESVVKAHDISPQALYYLEPGKLRHRIVLAGEKKRNQTEESQDATKAIREMIASGKLSKLVTVSIQGRPQTVQIEQEGPIVYVETTTLEPGEIFDEDLNRCWGLSCDESDQQTRNIILREAEKAAGLIGGDEQYVAKLCHTMQRLLKPREVVIPFATRLAGLIPKRESRRAFSRLLSIIQASALLHQYSRETDEEGRIIAQVDDYAIAFQLYQPNLEDLLVNQLQSKEAEKWEAIRTNYKIGNKEMTDGWSADDVIEAMAGQTGFKRDSVYRLINVLLSNGLIVRVGSSKPSRYRQTRNTPQLGQELGLPTPSELDFASENENETPRFGSENRKEALSRCQETTYESDCKTDGFGESESGSEFPTGFSDLPIASEMASDS